MGKKSRRRANKQGSSSARVPPSADPLNIGAEMMTDEMGRCFCKKHHRAVCHECCFDFGILNEQAEADVGLRQPKSELETLAEDRANLIRGIQYLRQNGPQAELERQEQMLVEVEEKLRAMEGSSNPEAIQQAMQRAQEQVRASDAQRTAIAQAYARENPGQTHMEWGGAETQRLYEQFASAPPTDESRVDKYTCSYCAKVSTEKLPGCSKCNLVSYCNAECQKAAWGAHKAECLGEKDMTKRKGLPLTWKQVEAHLGNPVEKKVLEVRAITNESMFRQVFGCKDREGVVKRIAAYTNSGKIPGLEQGCILRWKNPRFHWFADGSSGARIEESDLSDITVTRA